VIKDSNRVQQLAGEIVSLSDRLTDCWAQLDYYAKHKTLRDDSTVKEFNVDDLEIHEIITRLLTLPSFITKTKKKIKLMTDDDKKSAMVKLVEEKEKELKAIKQLRFKK
jgi:hypothetical protein